MKQSLHSILLNLPALFLSAVSLASQESSVTCKDLTNCPSGVAYIASKNKACTGFLIDSKTIATNRHCFSAEQISSKSCENVKVIFPKTPSSKEVQTECLRIKAIGPELKYEITPDWSLIEVKDEVDIKPLAISKSSIQDLQKVHVVKMNPLSQTSLQAELEVIQCQIQFGSHINPLSKDSQSVTLSLLPCSVQAGNSGSPILNQNDEVVGLLNAKSELTYKSKIPYLKQTFHQAAYGTHKKCLEPNPPEDCLKSLTESDFNKALSANIDEVLTVLQKAAESEVKKSLDDLYEKSGRIYRWTLESSEFSEAERRKQTEQGILGIQRFKPLCININRESIRKTQDRLKRSPIEISYTTYRLVFLAKYNDSLKMNPSTDKIPESMDVSITPSDLLKNKVPISWIRKVDGKTITSLKEDLPHCP